MSDSIYFEIDDMAIDVNIDLIEHIYYESTHKLPIPNRHPLELICDSVKEKYKIKISTKLVNKNHGHVLLSFQSAEDPIRVRQVSDRFKMMTETLLTAKLICITDKPH